MLHSGNDWYHTVMKEIDSKSGDIRVIERVSDRERQAEGVREADG